MAPLTKQTCFGCRLHLDQVVRGITVEHMATKSESEIKSGFAALYVRLGMESYDPMLKGKYLTDPASRVKGTRRTKVGNSGSMTKAQRRMPRLPAPKSCKGSEGWKPWMAHVRCPWKAMWEK